MTTPIESHPVQPFPIARQRSNSLGQPLGIREVAELIGCSAGTVRHTLVPRGLPCFRFRPAGRLNFYKEQVIRWIETEQKAQAESTGRRVRFRRAAVRRSHR